ncbi:hypothetical protein V6N12_007061 [Hibiscus sabdariffa]|uniref:Aminotransferase class I/classII large domain-containing protein n=1 Tax=Hibiscus sabdariffa TaxID=183260 RepID=A0ABR2F0P7_9ROSI
MTGYDVCIEVWNKRLNSTSAISLRGIIHRLIRNLSTDDPRPIIPLDSGDPSQFPCFRTSTTAEEAIVEALRSTKHNGYAPATSVPSARRPCFTFYESRAAYENLQVRHFDLLPNKGWEVDVEALADGNTFTMVIINPGNPCGSVYSYDHLKLVAETARKLGIPVIADEVYSHLTFGSTPFVPMGVFGSIVPVLSLGSISKRWVVPSWRLDSGVNYRVLQLNHRCRNLRSGTLKEAVEKCVDGIKDVPCLTFPSKQEGSMFVLVKLNVSLLEDIGDDLEFCMKLAKEEKVIIVPVGMAFGMKNWVRITFAYEISAVEEGLRRIKDFYQRHAKKQ